VSSGFRPLFPISASFDPVLIGQVNGQVSAFVPAKRTPRLIIYAVNKARLLAAHNSAGNLAQGGLSRSKVGTSEFLLTTPATSYRSLIASFGVTRSLLGGALDLVRYSLGTGRNDGGTYPPLSLADRLIRDADAPSRTCIAPIPIQSLASRLSRRG
jgi:hypothetical protein